MSMSDLDVSLTPAITLGFLKIFDKYLVIFPRVCELNWCKFGGAIRVTWLTHLKL